MKKIALCLLSLLSLLLLFGCGADDSSPSFSYSSAPQEYGDFIYTVRDNGAHIIGYTGSATTVEIPEKINGHKVIVISKEAFCDCDTLESVTVPSHVTSIEKEAFAQCDSLRSVTFAENSALQSIGENAFERCTSLESICIPRTLRSIGYRAFFSCVRLNELSFEDGDTELSIWEYAFAHCTSLESIAFPAGVDWLGNYAFVGCGALREVHFVPTDDGIFIGNGVFAECSALKAVEIPAGVQRICADAFRNCKVLQSVTFHEDSRLKEIEDGAFSGCYMLAEITIPAGVTHIGNAAFYQCIKLKNVTFRDENTLLAIGRSAFYGCEALVSINIPSSILSVGTDAFENCNKLSYSVYKYAWHLGNEQNPYLILVKSTDKWAKRFEPHEETRVICDGAFKDHTALEEIVISDSVISMGNDVFDGCPKLSYFSDGNARYLGNADNPYLVLMEVTDRSITEFTVLRDTKFIYCHAFEDCTELLSFAVREGGKLIGIGDAAFYGCISLQKVIIPDSVTQIGFGVFDGCQDSLKNVYCEVAERPFGWMEDWWQDMSVIRWGTVEKDGFLLELDYDGYYSVKAYLGSATSVVIPSAYNGKTVSYIYSDAFVDHTTLESVTIPAGILSVGSCIFRNCTALKDIYCEAEAQPKNWSSNWKRGCAATVHWGHSGK